MSAVIAECGLTDGGRSRYSPSASLAYQRGLRLSRNALHHQSKAAVSSGSAAVSVVDAGRKAYSVPQGVPPWQVVLALQVGIHHGSDAAPEPKVSDNEDQVVLQGPDSVPTGSRQALDVNE